MGILDKLAGMFGGSQPQGGAGNPLVHHILTMISDPSTGGLQGLVQSFHDKGLGAVVSSWVSTGANQPISPDQVAHALGADRVQQMAQATGVPAASVATQLSALLPTIIDKLTPQGTIPQGGVLAQGLSMLRNSLGAHPAPATPTATTTPTK